MHSFVAMPMAILVIFLCSYSIICFSLSPLAVVSKSNIIVASAYLQALPTGWVGGLHPSGMNNLRCDGFEPINSASQKDNI